MRKSKRRSKAPVLSRRDFLKLAALDPGILVFRPLSNLCLAKFPPSEKLGRVVVGKLDVYARPDAESPIVSALEDNVVPWIPANIGPLPGARLFTMEREFKNQQCRRKDRTALLLNSFLKFWSEAALMER